MASAALKAAEEKTILNLGCGNKKFADALNLDVTARTNPDLIHNLNHYPWPVPNNFFTEVRAYDVIEHLDDILATMEEIHRVCRHGAIVQITVPHYSCANAFTDPTHQHYFGFSSMFYFTEGNATRFYSTARFRIRKTTLVFQPTLMNKLIWRLANRFPEAYEQRWAWIFPAWYLHYQLEVLK